MILVVLDKVSCQSDASPINPMWLNILDIYFETVDFSGIRTRFVRVAAGRRSR